MMNTQIVWTNYLDRTLKKLENKKIKIILFFFILSCGNSNEHQNIFYTSNKVLYPSVALNKDNLIYFRARCWGITGNHEQIILSNDTNLYKSSSNSLVFYTNELYYEFLKDEGKLKIYTDESSYISSDFDNLSFKEEIIIINLRKMSETDSLARNYKDIGLQRVSIFD